MTQPTSLPPGAETIQVPVDFHTYQQQLRRLMVVEIGDKLADSIMDRAMLSAQVEVLYRKVTDGESERAELTGQVGVLTQQLRAHGAEAATDGDGEVSEGDTR